MPGDVVLIEEPANDTLGSSIRVVRGIDCRHSAILGSLQNLAFLLIDRPNYFVETKNAPPTMAPRREVRRPRV